MTRIIGYVLSAIFLLMWFNMVRRGDSDSADLAFIAAIASWVVFYGLSLLEEIRDALKSKDSRSS